ncbi:hypothetical protein C2857_006573 [Epichloe festucae Fl1]|uniref:Uncharacterized protein n=1 Tax=Epichloe festucae (strain Fl1) TaxID=877507 RepID=A0A7S9KQ36_EPIFF|nr:hypothetical protein C2857_006573 [Epichloe festucae Fl1]
MSSPSLAKASVVGEWNILNRQFMLLSDGRQYCRKINTQTGTAEEWVEVERADAVPPSVSTTEPKKLHLMLQVQAAGESMHWSLFVCREEDPNTKGRVWQVKGDATFMHYMYANEAALFASQSYYTSYALNSNLSKSQESLVNEAAGKEKPPRAKDQRSVRENCQGWTVRVLRRLQRDGVVKKETVDWIEKDVKEVV